MIYMDTTIFLRRMLSSDTLLAGIGVRRTAAA